MKKSISILALVVLGITSCNVDDLKILNPNDPGLGSLNSETGIKAFAAGMQEKAFGWHNSFEAGTSPYMVAMGFHSIMGDDMYVPWGNWGWRWAAIYNHITINATGDSYDHTLYPGISQLEFMQGNNSRAAGEVNAFKYEWIAAYWMIQQANQLLVALDGSVAFGGDAEVRKNTLRVWAYWWKGFMYSRIGSMYLAGLKVSSLGNTNPEYVSRQDIMTEASLAFDEAEDLLADLDEDEDYLNVWNSLIPDFNNKDEVVSPEMWTRIINTYRARNILVNTKVTDMTVAQWDEIISLANSGIQASDNIFTLGWTADGNNDFAGAFYHPYYWNNTANGWWFVSERLIQEYKPGDERLNETFEYMPDPADWEVNKRGRGWTFGTRYLYKDIESGGRLASATGEGQWPISPSFEENQLMLAEAKLRKNDLTGLAHVDAVRNYQGAGLSAVNGTGLNQTQALEEFRKERRVSLALRGLSFYDARRWGVTSAGGGRSDAMVLVPANVYDPEDDGAPGVYPCFIEYNFVDYWDLPADELDFNIPSSGSVAVKN